MTGKTNRVKNVPINRPAIITIPMLNRLNAPAPVAPNNGNKPVTIAAVVIRIGRRRMRAAFFTASIFDN